MSQRVTRSSAARLAADSSPNDPPTHNPTDTTPTAPTLTRKRKAASTEQSPATHKDHKKTKRSRADNNEELEAPEPAEAPKKRKRKSTAAAMSSAGYGNSRNKGEDMTDPSRPSSSTSGESSPQNLAKDSSKRKSRKSGKDGESGTKSASKLPSTDRSADPVASASGTSSRKSKRGSRKDHDTLMKDVDEKAGGEPKENEEDDEQQQDTQEGADVASDARRRQMEEDMEALDRAGGDPFGSSGFLSRFGGPGGPGGLAGLGGLTSQLRAMTQMLSGTGTRLRGLLEQLKAKDDTSTQLIALTELSDLLLVSNEDNLAGHFAPDQFVKELVTLMQPNDFTGEENPEIMLLACRCIANLMEALPAATASVVYGGAVPVLCQKLLEIHFIDLAEQALTTLEKISVEFPSSIVREGGLTACLTYLDFFATSTQRTAVTTAANCCRNIPEESFPTVRDVMPILLNTLSSSDQRVVEQASLCVCRVIESFKYHDTKLEELVSVDLLKAILRLLLPGSTNMISPNTHTQFLRVLSISARASPRLSAELLKMNVVDTLYQVLTGVSPPSSTEQDVASQIDKNVIMQSIIRTPREQIFETLNVICELLPTVSSEGLMFLNDLQDAGYTGPDNLSMSDRSKMAPNEKRVELLKGCRDEVKRFAIIMFPTLMHAYTSTVNLSVRQKVLTAQLKMLSNLETDILEEALRGVSYASHLASILSQQENPTLVTFALQEAELMLKRMESVYRPQFYREGVMTEIEKLANRALKSDEKPAEPSPAEKTDEKTVVAQPAEPEKQNEDHDEPAEPVEPVEHIDIDADIDVDDVEHIEPEDGDEEHDEDDPDHDEDDEASDSEPPSDDRSSTRVVQDVQDVITLRSKRFIEVHGHEGSEQLRLEATTVLNDLRTLADDLKACYNHVGSQGGADLFKRLAKYFDGDALESITSYELMTSGIVDVLLQILNDPDEEIQVEARGDFIEAFMTSKPATTVATGSASSPATSFSVLVHKLQELLSRAEHFEVITVHQNAMESNRSSAASMLAKQLRLKLTADEESGIPRAYRNIMVSIHAIATFKSLDDHLRPRISIADRARPSRSGREISGMPGAIAAYAAAMAGRERTSAATGSRASTHHSPSGKRSSKSENEKPKTPEQAPIPDSVVRRSSRRKSGQASSAAAQPSSQENDEAGDASKATDAEPQVPLECADEAHLSEDEGDGEDDEDDDEDMEAELDALVDDLEEEGLQHDGTDPDAVNMEVGTSGKVTAHTDGGDRINTPTQGTPTPAAAKDRMSATARLAAARELLSTPSGGSSSRPSSYAAALQQTPQDWHIEFSINGQPIDDETTIYRACHFNQAAGRDVSARNIWSTTHTISYKKVQGPPSESKSLTPPIDSATALRDGSLPPSLDKHPATASILRLMSILHNLNANLDEVMAENKTGLKLNPEPLTQFVNTKLTAKLNRQLEEPLIVASHCLPTWSEDLARLYPFLFPFETRHLFLQSTSFGYSRSMARWTLQENESRSGRHRDHPLFMGRPQRQKVRISRTRILESAIKVMEMYGSSPSMLEVEYFEEVGTGLGPTLEFYSTVSKEFSRKKTKLWRENESSSGGDYAFGRRGLFPAPMNEDISTTENGQRVLHLFKVLGKFIARSMLDGRIIDVSMNPTFFRVGDGGLPLNLGAVATVDQDLARSLKMLKKYVAAKQRLDEDVRLSDVQKAAKIDQIRINDAKIEDLGLDFTLPGYPNIELVEGGADVAVTMENINTYIRKVIEVTLSSGVQRQVDAFRAGFSQVFPYSALKAFTPDELVMLFGRVEEDWSLETLMDSIKADHGYNLDSKSVRNLLQVMSELSEEDRRAFLQFITGSPKLPIGGQFSTLVSYLPEQPLTDVLAGFKSLTPMFTVVCKPAEAPYASDDFLPSVMTCVNYLKMPDYSDLETLRAKLDLAVKEGQGSFHLS
jgi:E3 ubiquitin-protein ligase TRIP12